MGEYLNGEKNGYAKEYFDNGKIQFDGHYLNGEKNGFCKEYNKDGDLSFKGEYLKGKKWNGEDYNFLLGRMHEYRNGVRNNTYNEKYLYYCSII